MRGLRRNERFENLCKQLVEEKTERGKKEVFPTFRELMTFAAALGFDQGRSLTVDGPSKEIESRILENHPPTVEMIDLIALAETKDSMILLDGKENDRLDIFERYANGGLEVLGEWLIGSKDLWNPDQIVISRLRDEGYLPDPSRPEVIRKNISFD